MKKILLFTLAAAVAFAIAGPGAWAQESASDEFTLEEITVTAEKRAVNLQKLPSSVVALPGEDLQKLGKITTQQILESVPNVVYRAGSGTNPDGNITIRGVQRTQASGGVNAILPSTTAIYVDGVYQGIGGNYDVDRVEVLRGPQGTLYGRSATGGVISFYTNNPKLSEFSGNVSAEFGTASLINIQGAVNVPAGEKVAFRAAARFYERDGYFDAEGGYTQSKEGRLKALFQPTDALEIVLGLSAAETKQNGGGWQVFLDGPNDFNYQGRETVISEGSPNKYRQASLNVNYDFGSSTLTYIGGYHDYDNTGLGAELGKGEALHRDVTDWPTDYYHTEEIRWASDTDQKLTWLVGANYFKHEFDTSIYSVQTAWPYDPNLPFGDPPFTNPDGMNAPIFGQASMGFIDNYGVFTEETFHVADNFRITAGLRYDKTKMDQFQTFDFNDNQTPRIGEGPTALGGQSLNPPIWTIAKYHDIQDWDNVTYKLRFEYDLTPDNMIYALTATGFMPGFAAISPKPFPSPVTFQVLLLEQQKLTSYEIGSKNTFLNNTLRLNGDVFYYDYEGYVEAVNTVASGPPIFTPMAVPLEMFGVEVSGEYLLTMNDKVTFDVGYVKIEIADLPIFGVFDSADYMALTDQLPGNPDLTANLGYDHTFLFGNGSTLVPRAQLRYKSGHYLNQMTQVYVDLGLKPYNYQDAYVIGDLAATWSTADGNYSITGYVRNVFDEEYKAGVGLSTTVKSVTPGDPRTWGLMVNAKF